MVMTVKTQKSNAWLARDMRHESEPLWNQLMHRLVVREANYLP
jgi:hypothetical protein